MEHLSTAQPLEPQQIVAKAPNNNDQSRFDGYSINDILEDEELFEDFSPSQVKGTFDF